MIPVLATPAQEVEVSALVLHSGDDSAGSLFTDHLAMVRPTVVERHSEVDSTPALSSWLMWQKMPLPNITLAANPLMSMLATL